ncbi:MAG TPA: hypothetical protein VKD00_06995 [Methyloceanibacter sp.]|nr:hypothetical protein [Methyloceanibacter sp.]
MTMHFSKDELALLAEALDSHAYWQVSEQEQRNDGYVYHDENDDNHDDLAAIEQLQAKIEAHLSKED